MFEKSNSSFITNGSNNSRFTENIKYNAEPTRFSSKISLNEWTCSLMLLALSLTIVLGKLCVNYGSPNLSSQTGNRYSMPWTFTQMYDRIPSVADLPKFDMRQLSVDRERFGNAGNEYAGTAANVLVAFYEQYWWFLQALMCGFLITSFTWFIIYKDSSIPGVNPPSPFSLFKQRICGYSGCPKMQMNYLVGMLNGILFFIYMCF